MQLGETRREAGVHDGQQERNRGGGEGTAWRVHADGDVPGWYSQARESPKHVQGQMVGVLKFLERQHVSETRKFTLFSSAVARRLDVSWRDDVLLDGRTLFETKQCVLARRRLGKR